MRKLTTIALFCAASMATAFAQNTNPQSASASNSASVATAEAANDRANLLFETGKAVLSAEGKAQLRALAAQNFAYYEVNGHTDADGAIDFNQRLSAKRNLAVADFLTTLGVRVKQMHTNAFGETHPLADNTADGGKQQNRRVEVVGYKTILSDFDSYTSNAQRFVLRNTRDTSIFAKNGTRIDIPQGAFKTTSNAPIFFNVEEYYKPLDMLMAGLTTRAGDKMLETGGMLRITAEQEGNALELQKAIRLQMPKFKDLNSEVGQASDYQLFNGQNDPHAARGINWTVSETTAQLTGSNNNGATNMQWASWKPYGGNKIGRSRKSIKKLYVPDGIIWDTVQGKRIKHYFKNETTRRKDSVFVWERDTIESGNFQVQVTPNDANLKKFVIQSFTNLHYSPAASLLAKYKNIRLDFSVEMSGDVERITPYVGDVKDSLAILKVVNSWFPIKDAKFSPIIKTWVRVDITNNKSEEIIKTQEGNSRGSVLAANMQNLNGGFSEYYLFETTSLGWINCDRFQSIPNPIDMIVKTSEKAKMRLVFKNMHSIMNVEADVHGNYKITRIPSNEPVFLVGLMEKEGKALIAFKELRTSATPVTDLQFELATPEKLEKLSALMN